MVLRLGSLAPIASVGIVAMALAAHAQQPTQPPQPDRIRGQITVVEPSSLTIQTAKGENVHIALPDQVTVLGLSAASFADVDFGVYVGAASVRLDAYSPIIRDSLSWLHQGFELRIIDEALRGIALGHTPWDLTSDSVMSHGWVDDLEVRVISIKYGPTEEEETDVEVSRDTPVLKMALADRALIRPGAHVLVGAEKLGSGDYSAVFVIAGENGIVPPL